MPRSKFYLSDDESDSAPQAPEPRPSPKPALTVLLDDLSRMRTDERKLKAEGGLALQQLDQAMRSLAEGEQSANAAERG
jgi:hypothetical protein